MHIHTSTVLQIVEIVICFLKTRTTYRRKTDSGSYYLYPVWFVVTNVLFCSKTSFWRRYKFFVTIKKTYYKCFECGKRNTINFNSAYVQNIVLPRASYARSGDSAVIPFFLRFAHGRIDRKLFLHVLFSASSCSNDVIKRVRYSPQSVCSLTMGHAFYPSPVKWKKNNYTCVSTRSGAVLEIRTVTGRYVSNGFPVSIIAGDL